MLTVIFFRDWTSKIVGAVSPDPDVQIPSRVTREKTGEKA